MKLKQHELISLDPTVLLEYYTEEVKISHYDPIATPIREHNFTKEELKEEVLRRMTW